MVQSLGIPIGFFGVLCNAVVLTAYIKYSDMRKVECAHLIAALAFCDFFIGWGIIVISLSRLPIGIFLWFDFSRLYCIATAALWLVAQEMSHIIVASIAIDRFRAMSRPFSYSSINHRKYAKCAFLVALLAGFIILLLSFMGNDYSDEPSRCSWSKLLYLQVRCTVSASGGGYRPNLFALSM
jgi:hypothetical protein